MNAFLRLARYHKPIPVCMLLLPCWWSIALTDSRSTLIQNLPLLFLFLLGAFVMRGAGCTYNDIIDRNIDRHVTRTKNRPLATGEISVIQAWFFLILQCLGGLAILLFLPGRCWLLTPLALTLLAIYPFMKRLTHWPQAVLGLAFNFGIFFGAGALVPFEKFNWLALLALYGAGISWTIGYDTLYALQDREDDLAIGIKSTTICFGRHVKSGVYAAYVLMFLLLIATGYLAGAQAIYYIILIISALATSAGLAMVQPGNVRNCLTAFNVNAFLGAIVWVALLCLR